MSSQRLPGKVLRELHGHSILGWLLRRLQKSKTISEIVVATSTHESDDLIEHFCKGLSVPYVRGPLDDVVQRFQNVLTRHPCKSFVRVCADSPMIDPYLLDSLVRVFNDGNYDLVTNVLTRTFPKGQSIEILASNTFCEFARGNHSPDDREHVTSYFYKNQAKFKIRNIESGYDLGHIQLSIDTEQDFIRICSLFERFDPNTVTWLDLASDQIARSGFKHNGPL